MIILSLRFGGSFNGMKIDFIGVISIKYPKSRRVFKRGSCQYPKIRSDL